MNQAQAIAQVLLERKSIRTSMRNWCVSSGGFTPALHQELLMAKLEQVAARTVKKLAIFMPPGSAKSYYTSRKFPAWFLAQCHAQAILLCSHSKDLAEDFGRSNRNDIEAYPKELGYELARDSQAAAQWKTNKGGEFFCAGVGGRISGRRADLGVIDDPIGSQEDADSKDIRDKHWAWYKGDFKPRLKPGSAVALIQTRWHEDDLAGRILQDEKGWEVIRLPMEAEDNDPLGRKPGDLLWPEWFTQEMADDAKKDTRVWNSLYQQNPIPEKGNYFEKDGIRTYSSYDDIPKNLKIYAGSDHALGVKEENDFTCMPTVGLDEDGNLWVLPVMFWDKCNTLTCVNEMFATARRRPPLMWFCESQHIEKSIGPFLFERMRDQEFYFSMQQLSGLKDKQAKARPLQGRIAQGKVFFPSFASWWGRALHELTSFPSGTHDDFIDALANICRGLESLIRPGAVRSVRKPDDVLSVRWLKGHMKETLRRAELLKLDY